MNIRAKIYGDWVEEPLLKAKKPKGAKADELDSIAVRAQNRASAATAARGSASADRRARADHP